MAHIQEERFQRYIKERDDDRATRSDSAFWHDNSLTYSAKVFSMQRSPISMVASKCRLLYDKHWHGRNRQKDDTLSEAERQIVSKCILCQAQDSQEHTFHQCSNKTLSTLRNEIRINLNKHIHQYDTESALHRQIGRAVLQVLDTTNEPGRLWTGNLSADQIHQITALLNPNAINTITQTQLTSIFLPISRILADGCLNLNHHKLLAEQQQHTNNQSTTSGHPNITTALPQPDKQRHKQAKSTMKTNTKPNRNPTGRLLYRQLPPHLTTTNTLLQPVISLDRPPPRIINRYTTAVLQSNFNTKITSIDDNTLYGYHFQRLQQNAIIHDTVVHAYLRLIQRRSQGTVKAMDFITIHRLKQGDFSHIDRQFRTKDIFAHDWILFPILKMSHFTLIAVRPHHNGRNHILFYDSLTQDCTEEVDAVHNYLRHVAQHTHRPEYESWDIDMHATVAFSLNKP